MSNQLNPKQLLFAEEYIKDYNATQAAIRAGYSPKTAGSQGGRLLNHVEIQKLIAKAIENRAARVQYDSDALLKDILQMKDRVQEAIASMPVEALDATLVNAFARLTDQLGKHVDVQAWKERMEVVHVDHADVMERAIARVENADRSKRLH
jgi:phage terminase small subunit